MKNLLEKLGAKGKEIDTYLTLLELGPQPISSIARRIGVPRSTMYTIIDGLKKLHLVEKFQRAKVTFVQAIPAKQIYDVIKLKEHELEIVNDLYESVLPDLEGIENKSAIAPKIKFYEGEDEVKRMYETVISEGGFDAYSNPKVIFERMPEYYLQLAEKLKERGLSAREILVDCPESHEYKKLFGEKLHQIKILPKGVDFESDTIIAEDRFFQVAYGEHDIVATETASPSLTKTQKEVFEIMWNSI